MRRQKTVANFLLHGERRAREVLINTLEAITRHFPSNYSKSYGQLATFSVFLVTITMKINLETLWF